MLQSYSISFAWTEFLGYHKSMDDSFADSGIGVIVYIVSDVYANHLCNWLYSMTLFLCQFCACLLWRRFTFCSTLFHRLLLISKEGVNYGRLCCQWSNGCNNRCKWCWRFLCACCRGSRHFRWRRREWSRPSRCARRGFVYFKLSQQRGKLLLQRFCSSKYTHCCTSPFSAVISRLCSAVCWSSVVMESARCWNHWRFSWTWRQ